MIVYHGSDSNFKKLRISTSLVKHRTTLENEGAGIYFSTNKDIARSYGKYLYTLEVNDQYVKDFRNKRVCARYIADITESIYKTTNVNMLNYIDKQMLIDRMRLGGLCICRTGREIYMLLESTEEWYKIQKVKKDKAYSILRKYDKSALKCYMFPYHIKNIGVLKSVDPLVVMIVNKESSY